MAKASDKTFLLLYANALKGILANPTSSPMGKDSHKTDEQEALEAADLALIVATAAMRKLEEAGKTEGE